MHTSIKDFVRESNRIEGIHRDPTAAEIEAHYHFLEKEKLTVYDLVNLVSVLQPDARLRDNISMPGVRVGNHIAPPSGPEIRERLEYLLEAASNYWQQCIIGKSRTLPGVKMTDYEIHCEYEVLHPFTDGNGRSGRALWLWARGGHAPLGFLHQFYYQTLSAYRI